MTCGPGRPEAKRYFSEAWTQPEATLSARAGTHRVVWDLRGERPRAISYGYGIAAVFKEGTPITPAGLLVAPGDYTVALSVDGEESRAPLKIVADPRVAFDAGSARAAVALAGEVSATLDRAYVAYGEMQAVDKQLDAAEKTLGKKAVAIARLRAAAKPLHDDNGDGDTAIGLAAIGGLLGELTVDLEGSDRAPTQPQRDLLASCNARLARALTLWSKIKQEHVPAVDAELKAAGIAPIAIPAADQIKLISTPESNERP